MIYRLIVYIIVDVLNEEPLMKELLKKIRIKKNYKEFNRNSIHGEKLGLDFTSRCISDHREDIQIGNRCEIKGTLRSFQGGRIIIGDNFYMGYRSFIGAMDSIVIGNDVIISSDVRIFDNNNHPTEPNLRRQMSHSDFYGELWTWKYAAHKPIEIADNVWIGEFSAILKGVHIGGAIVASHSVVTKDVPPNCIVAGNPAKVVKKLTK